MFVRVSLKTGRFAAPARRPGDVVQTSIPGDRCHNNLIRPVNVRQTYTFNINMLIFLLIARMPAPRFYLCHLVLRSYDYNLHVAGLLPANSCLVTLLSWNNAHNLKDSACIMFKW